jgi:hypothetical protein
VDTLLGSVPVLYRRADVTVDDFRNYWRDIHGVFVATFLGPSRYRMLHFAAYDPSVWCNGSISRDLAPDSHLGGIAEFAFLTESERSSWLNTVGTFADADDANVFRRSTSYSVSERGFQVSKASGHQPDSDETAFACS